jgi:hypothetical protein
MFRWSFPFFLAFLLNFSSFAAAAAFRLFVHLARIHFNVTDKSFLCFYGWIKKQKQEQEEEKFPSKSSTNESNAFWARLLGLIVNDLDWNEDDDERGLSAIHHSWNDTMLVAITIRGH